MRTFKYLLCLAILVYASFSLLAARGVQLDHQGFGLLFFRGADAVLNELRQPRIDGTFRRQHQDPPGRGLRAGCQQAEAGINENR